MPPPPGIESWYPVWQVGTLTNKKQRMALKVYDYYVTNDCTNGNLGSLSNKAGNSKRKNLECLHLYNTCNVQFKEDCGKIVGKSSIFVI